MNETDLKALFDRANKSVINPEAKNQAIQAAMAEFEIHSTEDLELRNDGGNKKFSRRQGLINFLRPTEQDNQLSRRDRMNRKNTTWSYGLLATASVALIAGFIVLNAPLETGMPLDNRSDMSRIAAPQSINEMIVETVKVDEPQIVVTHSNNEEFVVSVDVEEPGSNTGSLDRESPLAMTKEARSLPPVPEESVSFDLHESPVLTTPNKGTTYFTFDTEIAASGKPQIHRSTGSILPPPSDYREDKVRQEYRERFENIESNPVQRVAEKPVSTFSIDVDTASYSFVRRSLNRGLLPDKSAVRVEEFLNYFDYDYPVPKDRSKPFTTNVIVGDAPWNPGNKLIHIGIKGYEIEEQPKSNLVFLLDVSGSMADQDKLPLVKQSIGLLLSQLEQEDTVAIVVYAGTAGTVLEPTPVKDKYKIQNALNMLEAGGSTAGAEGIRLAYQLAEQNFDKSAINRIILATDGDFNVGIDQPEQLKGFVERKREQGIYLSVLGFGGGNYFDQMMQSLAQNGNGVATYIDTISEARKVLVKEATSSLFPIAQDVKIKVDFNPATVSEYRLIGYETRQLQREDFNNDQVDAGDIGSGHTVTALYEITPVDSDAGLIDDSRYASPTTTDGSIRDEYALLKLRFKLPGENESTLVEQIIPNRNTLGGGESSWQQREFQFSAAVAAFAQILEGGQYTGDWGYDEVIEVALSSRGNDNYGYRNEFVQLVRLAKVANEM